MSIEELKGLTEKKETRSERNWSRSFGWMGVIMFLAAIFETMVTMFWIGMEVVPMDRYRIGFASIGFVFALANRQLGVFANNIGAVMLDRFKRIFGE
ncbi:hypothetical protein [Flagellimonas marina]|uniref:Uncharacterized protein n=1 Tax=Flagellimonas marina TaxID=1775168 RepID=A0ABV8PIQ6_9FLAO